MAEPQSSFAALAVALAAPFAGPYAVIVVASLAGATWPLAAASTATRQQGAFLLLRLVLTSSALTGVLAWAVERHVGYPADEALAPVAFVIAWLGDAWRSPSALIERVVGVIKQVKAAITGVGQ